MNDRPTQRILTLIAIALTFASGATDVASFTRLGDVFTSVMTGNIVLLGLAVARESLTLASHTLVSICGYITGVAGATWIAHGLRMARAAKAGAAGAASGAGECSALRWSMPITMNSSAKSKGSRGLLAQKLTWLLMPPGAKSSSGQPPPRTS